MVKNTKTLCYSTRIVIFVKKKTMKKYVLGLLAIALVLVSCFDPSKKSLKGDFVEYGPFTVDASKAIPVDAMVADFDASGSKRKTYTISANIEEVCVKAGCWINITQAGGTQMMVRFKDHFTIPTDTKIGTTAYLHGDLYVDTISVDMLRHYAEDAGKTEEEINKITAPKINKGFEADGIKFIAAKK